jgi:4-amino-4-deoxy-L-arabinose transferase and related glycosyltransferases of PMT family
VPNLGILSEIEAWFKRKTGQDIVLVSIVLIFFIGLLPLAASLVVDFPHPERHYTDAALSMRQSNDFLTPRYGDGSFRFRKPPLIYWLMVGSYQLLGVSFFSSRVVFLITGCATIWLAYALAFKLTENTRAARATALILLSQPVLIMTSVRSMPDILLTFWMLVSAYGFIRLICFNDTRPRSYWAAYGGAAIAVATKGLLPVAFVAYALIFAYFTSSSQQPFRQVLNLKVILSSIFISCFSAILMFWKHGRLFLETFWNDQVGAKVDLAGNTSIFLRIGGYFLICIALLLPWLLCLAYLCYKQKSEKPVTRVERKACVFILIWAALSLIIFGFGNFVSTRYLLPAIPLVAVAMSIALCRFSNSAIAIVTDQLLNILTIVFFAIAIFGVTLLWQTDLLTRHFAGLAILSLAILLVAIRFRTAQLSSQGVFSLSFFLLVPLVAAIGSPFRLPDQSTQIARELRLLNTTKASVFLVGPGQLASRIRISNGGQYPVYQADSIDLLEEKTSGSSDHPILILRQSDAQHLSPDSFQFREIASGLDNVSLSELLKATARGQAKSYLNSREEHYYAAIPISRLNK